MIDLPKPSLEMLSPLQRAALALKEMRSRIDALERSQTEAIAIVGMGCRFPGGAANPEAFWQLLQDGVDAIRDVPATRWRVEHDNSFNPVMPDITSRGGFLEEIDQFDAEFFGLSPREAISMDPQQRLLLEVSWEALEQAGIPVSQLMGSKTGVFIGISLSEYLQSALFRNAATIDIYTATGNALSVAAGRIAYLLGLHGPSIAIDTACSSSLVAVHLACQSLRLQECNLALAGGVSLMLAPQTTLAMAKLNALSADGHCKTFDAAADGYGRGEGCGVIALKRLTDAQADGDRILAVIRGSAVNQDGRSSGLTVPNGIAQQAVIRTALCSAHVAPEQIYYVETHGTGTPLGDPIEVGALDAVLGSVKSRSHPLMLGSVKTNIGHLEAAAGIASLIKVVLAIQHQEIPPHLHLHQVNPHINLTDTKISVPTQRTPWQVDSSQSHLAGVSAFGFSGTNAHLIVESAPELACQPAQPRSAQILCLSAKTATALDYQVERLMDYLQAHPDVELADVCFTTNVRRSHFSHRLALQPSTLADLQTLLQARATRQPLPPQQSNESTSDSQPTPLKLAFYFPHESSQSLSLGQHLYNTEPDFQATLNDCITEIDRHRSDSFLAAWREIHSLDDSSAQWQRLINTVRQYALAQLWRLWGIEPVLMLGDGVGERVANCVSGALSIEALIQQVLAETDPSPDVLAIAHSAEMPPCQSANPPAILSPTQITALQAASCDAVVVIGSDPFTVQLEAPTRPWLWLSSLDPEQDDWTPLLHCLSQLYVRGLDINWQVVERGQARSPVSLPTYPFERQRYWLESVPALPSHRSSLPNPGSHPLLGQRLASPLSSIQFEAQWCLNTLPLVRDHRLHGHAIVNLVVYLEMVQAGAIAAFGQRMTHWKSLLVPQPLAFESEQSHTVQLILTPQDSEQAEFQIFSLQQSHQHCQWILHATGQIQWVSSPSTSAHLEIVTLQHRCSDILNASTFYQHVQARGAELGSSCQVLDTIWRRDGEALGQLSLSELPGTQHYRLPLQGLDACFQLLTACLPEECINAYVILSLEELQIDDSSGDDQPVWAYAQISTQVLDWSDPSQTATLSAHVMLLDCDGKCLVKATHLQLRQWQPAASASIRSSAQSATSDFDSEQTNLLNPSRLLQMPVTEQSALVEQYLMTIIAHLLRLPTSRLNAQQFLAGMIDSLIAFELRNRIESDLQVCLPIEQFLGTSTIAQLATRILEQLAIAPLAIAVQPAEPSSEILEDMESTLL